MNANEDQNLSNDYMKVQLFGSYIKNLKAYKMISNFLKNLSNYAINPSYYEIVKEPVDIEFILQKERKGNYDSLMDYFVDCNKMLQNIFLYYEPESHAYRAALSLQSLSFEKFFALNHQKSCLPDVQQSVQGLLMTIFVETYNYSSKDRYLTESILRLPLFDWVGGVWKRVETLETIKLKLDRGHYTCMDNFQTSLFSVFKRARLSWELNSDLYDDSIELQKAYIAIRNRHCKFGAVPVISSQALCYGLLDLENDIQNDNLQNNVFMYKNIVSKDVQAFYDSFTNRHGEKFSIGDFIYVNPLESESISECLILEVESLLTDKEGQDILWGRQYFQPQDINLWHGNILLAVKDDFFLPVNYLLKFCKKELLKSDKSMCVPFSKVMGKCVILTQKDYTKLQVTNFPLEDVYFCRHLYDFSKQLFMDLDTEQEFNFPSYVATSERVVPLKLSSPQYISELKVKKRIVQFASLRSQVENNVNLLSQEPFDGQHYNHEKYLQFLLENDGLKSDLLLSCPVSKDLSVFEQMGQIRMDSDAAIEGNSSLDVMTAEADVLNEEHFPSEDIEATPLYESCCSVIGCLKIGDFVYIQPETEIKKSIMHIQKIILSNTGEFLLNGANFIMQEEFVDDKSRVSFSFNEVYLLEQLITRPVCHAIGRCIVLNFLDYTSVRPANTPEGDIHLCDFIFDSVSKCLRPLDNIRQELLQQDQNKMCKLSERIQISINRKHVINGEELPVWFNDIASNTASSMNVDPDFSNEYQIVGAAESLEIKKEAVSSEECPRDLFEIWETDLMSWLKEQKRLESVVSVKAFKERAVNYCKMYRLHLPYADHIKYFRRKYKEIIKRFTYIVSLRGRPPGNKALHMKPRNQMAPMDSVGTKDPASKSVNEKLKTWQTELMSWLKEQKKLNKVVSVRVFQEMAIHFGKVNQLRNITDKHIIYFRRKFKSVIFNDCLIQDLRGRPPKSKIRNLITESDNGDIKRKPSRSKTLQLDEDEPSLAAVEPKQYSSEKSKMNKTAGHLTKSRELKRLQIDADWLKMTGSEPKRYLAEKRERRRSTYSETESVSCSAHSGYCSSELQNHPRKGRGRLKKNETLNPVKVSQSIAQKSEDTEIIPRPVLCRNGCGFYGLSAMGGLCSKCHNDSLGKERVSSSSSVLPTTHSKRSSLLPSTSYGKLSCSSSSSSSSLSYSSSSEQPLSSDSSNRAYSSSPSSRTSESPLLSPSTSNIVRTSVKIHTKLKHTFGKSFLFFRNKRYKSLKANLPECTQTQLHNIISKEWRLFPRNVKLAYRKEMNHKAKMSQRQSLLEEFAEIERRRLLCQAQSKIIDQKSAVTSGTSFDDEEEEDKDCRIIKKYLKHLLQFFELPPDDLESYAAFKWLQQTMEELRLSNNPNDYNDKETWLNYSQMEAEQAFVHKLLENHLTIAEFKQLALSTPLLMLNRMSLAYENLF